MLWSMIPETPFFLVIATLSGSLAGLAGLVAGLRRERFGAIDLFRLREIVEFAFVNALISLSSIPLVRLLGGGAPMVRIVGTAAGVYLLLHATVLFRRLRRVSIALSTWVRVAATIDLAIVALALACLLSGELALLEILLILLLGRPMTVFLFVLASFEPSSDEGGP
jgi:hypothetical protein